jgi:hypothetical protein
MAPTIAHGDRRSGAAGPIVAALLVLAVSTGVASAQPASSTTRTSDDPFARRGWQLELGGSAALEAWNYNISHEELFGIAVGLNYGLLNGLVLTASWPLSYVSQRGVDAWVMGATIGVRGRIVRRPRWSFFLSGALGVSEADTFVPPRGTRFNYLAIGGIGVIGRVRAGVHLLAGLDVIHVSNAGYAGRDRNPDIEAIGPRLALLLGF